MRRPPVISAYRPALESFWRTSEDSDKTDKRDRTKSITIVHTCFWCTIIVQGSFRVERGAVAARGSWSFEFYNFIRDTFFNFFPTLNVKIKNLYGYFWT